ncbi:MAG: HAMP domain-containing sensor histidine kinase [Sinimarinibacterium sp.]|jgi:two-component system sensor histidine kinase GlrK
MPASDRSLALPAVTAVAAAVAPVDGRGGSGGAVQGERTVRRPSFRHWLQRWKPKTMAGLFGLGCLLVSLPPFVAVVMSGVALQGQAQRSERLVADGLLLERLGAKMIKELENLERAGLQYVALEDPLLLPVVERRYQAALGILWQIDDAGFPPSVVEHVRALERGLGDVATAWATETADVAALSQAMSGMRMLSVEAEAMVAAGRMAIDQRVSALKIETGEARRVTRVAALALVPLAATLAFGFSLVVTRPLRSLRSGIAALGTSNYRHRVEIAYPLEMSRLGEKLEWLRRRLALLEADKDRFLRHVSHELKTPLASISEGADLLIEGTLGPLSDRQAEVVRILADATAELEEQIRNLLAYAEWRNGRLHAECEWFAAPALIDEVVAAHRLPIGKRSLRIARDFDDGLRLHGQRPRLRVALDNLLSNAIKHAPPGSSIEIAGDRRNGCCLVSVRDFGRGIAADDRMRILEPFVRGSEEEESGVRGTGVGLSIVVETVNAHGGELEVQDANPGTRMVMVWPCPPMRG